MGRPLVKSPGTYYNPAVEYTPTTEALRGRPLVSEPLTFAIVNGDAEKEVRIEFLNPKQRKGEESVRVKLGRTTFSLAIITPRGSKESFVDAMFEDAEGLVIDGPPEVALMFLRIDMAARCGHEEALGAAAAAEVGLFLRRAWAWGERAAR